VAKDYTIAQRNALDGLPLRSAFFNDLAAAVSNSGCVDDAGRWLLSLGQSMIDPADPNPNPWTAWDAYHEDFIRIANVWPVMREARDLIAADTGISFDPCPSLARFVVDRLPALWWREFGTEWVKWCKPETRALVLADRSHDLIGLWMAGCKVTGSKDPYALRRAANHWLIAACSREVC
jgi:Glycyl-tRNA synthetase beta subunit